MTAVQAGVRRSRVPLAGLVSATALSFTGNQIVAVVMPWLVLAKTGSASLAGLVGAAAVGPMVLSTLFGGALVDRVGRRFASICADLLSAAAVAALPLLDASVGLGTGLILLLVALGAIFDGPGAAAREAMRPDVAKRAVMPLERVNAWGEAAENVGAIVGPGLAGLLLAWIGGFGTLWAAVGLFVTAVLFTVFTVPREISPEPNRGEPFLRSIVVGLKFVWNDRAIRAVSVTAMIAMLFVTPLTLVLTAHLQEAGRATDLALVLSSFAVGGLAGAIGYGVVGHRMPRRAALVGAVALAGLGFGGLAFLPPVWGMALLAGLIGLVAGPINPVCAVIMQERTPEHLRGRVIGTFASLAMAAGPLGMLVFGPVIQYAGAGIAFAVIGIGCVIAAGYAAASRGLREGV
jgi:MFS family permease